MNYTKSLVSIAVLASLAGVSSVANAAGFQLAEYSATGLGRAYAGEAAMADNASAQWRNPAMLTELEGTQISTGAIYVNPSVHVKGEVTATNPITHASSSSSTSADDFVDDAVVPNLYLSHQINEQWFAGLAISTNYGMQTKLPDDFGATHFGNEANLETIEINPNIAYKLTDNISIGGGVRYVKGKGHFGATVSPIISQGSKVPVGSTLKYIEGEDDAWGYQLGASWQINEANRIAFAYKSAVQMNFDGHVEGRDKYFQMTKEDGILPVELPQTAEIASFHQLTERFALSASLNWTQWSSFKKLEVNLDSGSKDLIKEENWRDNYRIALGGTYLLTSKLTLRTGVAYDMGAVNDANRSTSIPETNRTWFSVGASYAFTQQFTVDTGLTYIHAQSASIHEEDTAHGLPSFDGEMTGHIWLAGVQANYRF